MRELLNLISSILPSPNTKTDQATYSKKWNLAGELLKQFNLEMCASWSSKTGTLCGADEYLSLFISLLPIDPPFLQTLKAQLEQAAEYRENDKDNMVFSYYHLLLAVSFVFDNLNNPDAFKGQLSNHDETIAELVNISKAEASKVVESALNSLTLIDAIPQTTHIELVVATTAVKYSTEEANKLKQLLSMCQNILQNMLTYELPYFEKMLLQKDPNAHANYFGAADSEESKESILLRIHDAILERRSHSSEEKEEQINVDEAQINLVKRHRFMRDIFLTLIRFRDPDQRAIQLQQKMQEASAIFKNLNSSWTKTLSVFGMMSLETKFFNLVEAYKPRLQQEMINHP